MNAAARRSESKSLIVIRSALGLISAVGSDALTGTIDDRGRNRRVMPTCPPQLNIKMRRWLSLFEQQGPDQDLIDYYTSEGCGAFAYALWVAHGKPADGDIYLISNVDGEPWFGDEESEEPTHDFEATHAYYNDSNGSADILGYRSVDDMIYDFRIHANIEGPWSPDNFASEWMGETDATPLYGDHQMIADALKIIRQFPELYRINGN